MRADLVKARMKRRVHATRERGVALIMVLLSIVVLTVFATEVQQESSTTMASAISARERLKAEYAARSAVNLTRLLIATEPTIRAAVAPMYMLINQGKGEVPQIPVWEFIDQVLGPYNCPEKAEGFAQFAGVDTSTSENLGLSDDTCFDIVVVDEDAKINVNTAARPDIISATQVATQLLALMSGEQYNPLFEALDSDGQQSDRATICGALIDWADSDEDVELCDLSTQASTSRGVEDNYYQSIGLPYFRKNAGYDSLDELRMVRGMGDDLWATFVDPKPDDPKKRNLTVWGQGKINVNTANAQTLLALVCGGAVPETPLCIDPLQAASFLSVVTMAKTFTAGAPLFSSGADFVATMKGKGMIGPQFAAMGIEPVVFKSDKEMQNFTTTKSKMFSIYAEGAVTNRARETRVSIHAVVDFRNATELNPSTPAPTGGAPNANTPITPITPGQTPNTGTGGVEDLLAALTANPAGTMIYWRVQ
jgi:general secretion pathway protein K